MTSTLSTRAEEYLALRRSLGFKLFTGGRLLESFVAYLDEQGLTTVTVEAALGWATAPRGATCS